MRMFCKYCAAELEDGSNFCAMCGKPQQAQAVAPRDDDGARGLLVCVNCGKALERGWTLCPYCGTKVNVVPADEATPKIVDEPLADGKLEPEKAGLYDGNEYRGPLDILDSIDWITLNGKDGGNYLIVLGKDEAIPYAILDFEGKHVSVTLKTLGPECTVQRAGPFDKPLFEVGSGVTFTLEAGVALVGVSGNKASVVVVKKDGTFIMNGGSISGNSSEGNGGGVYVSGTFTMNGGTISRNS
ncbi:MAG: zinc ribbon domain-containing protein, partial [Treponema sp.]|nr:zinc ribbon domain-containing protein [Treponema sp.]